MITSLDEAKKRKREIGDGPTVEPTMKKKKKKSDEKVTIYTRMIRKTKNELQKQSDHRDRYCIEFGLPLSSSIDNESSVSAISSHQPVMLVLQEMIQQSDPRIVFTSAVAEAETDYESLVHQDDSRIALPDPEAKLWPYQEEAVQFLGNRERDTANVGCRGLMLCDEMGLGKTLETLTYIYRDLQRRQRETGRRFNGVTLIVIPGTLIDTWTKEIDVSFPLNSIHYIKMMGDKTPIPAQSHIENCTDIIFTTYTVVSIVYNRLFVGETGPGGDIVDDDEDGSIGSIRVQHRYDMLYKMKFRRVVLDEAHFIANRETARFRAMKKLNALSKWMNTGTPIQNSYKNIHACFDFIEVPLSDALISVFNTAGMSVTLSESDEAIVKNIMDRVMIRRLKHQIYNRVDTPRLFRLTEVDKKVVLIDFDTQQERILYLMYAHYGLKKMKGNKKGRREAEPRRSTSLGEAHKGGEDTVGGQGQERNINITSAIQLMRQCCIDFHIIRKPILPNGMLLGCNASSIKAKPTSFNEKLFYNESTSYEHVDRDNMTLEKEAFKHNNETVYTYRLDNDDVPINRTFEWHPYHCDSPLIDLNNDDFSRQLYRIVYDLMSRDAIDNLDVIKQTILGILLGNEEDDSSLLNQQIEAVYVHLMGRVLPRFSTKQRHVIDYINQIKDPTDKVMISSDSVCFLRSMAECLTVHGIKSCSITGESKKNRDSETQLRLLETDPTVRVLLSSLKKGGVGLNIQCVNHVISCSIWWNPHAESQSESRSDRIGQTKPVYVRYFVIRDTMEEYILSLSSYKKSISCQMIEKNDSDSMPIDDETLTRLFGFKLDCVHHLC